MKLTFQKLSLKGDFLKNTLTLTLGTSVAQAFPILFYPLLGRLFSPADFGLLATITSITAILAVLSTGGYEGSILITNTKKEAANVVGLVLILSITVLGVSFILLQSFSTQIDLLFNDRNLSKWLFLCPITAISIIIYNCYNEWCVKNKYFVNLSWNKIINSGSTTLGKVFFGFFTFFSSGLLIGDVLGRIISAIGCTVRMLKIDSVSFYQISFRRMYVLAKRYKAFPRFSLPGQLIDTVNTQLPTLVIASVFYTSQVGYFAMAGNLLSVPASVISIAVKDVFRQRAFEEWQKYGNCQAIYKKTVKVMFIIILPLSIFLMIILPTVFSVMLGEEWRVAGHFARILVPNVSVLFMFQVVAAVFIIANKMKISFYWQIFSICLTVISLSVGCFILKDIELTLILYVAARCIANLTRFYLTYKYSKGVTNLS